MILIDKQMLEKRDTLITPFSEDHVSNICYDLTTKTFCNAPGKESSDVTLAPGDTVFVKSQEEIHLPKDICAKVLLRNSRIRQGLDLTAPVYQPGHCTNVFYRITNISKSTIKLNASDSDGIASIMFLQLKEEVAKPYEGAFQSEFDFRGMGQYTSSLSKEMTDIEEKVDNIKSIEKDMYGNVLALMAIFVGIFSLINVNITLAAEKVNMLSIITLNFTTVGAIGFLVALINTILPSGKHRVAVWIACIAAFVLAIVVQVLAYYL